VSKLCALQKHKRGGLEGKTKSRAATNIATVASVTNLHRGEP